MNDAITELAEWFQRCLVRIDGLDRVLGSGVWVAPGLVLTCAHVAAHSEVTVVWQARPARARVVEAAPPEHAGSDGHWPYPDLALIEVSGVEGHPCAWLSEQQIAVGTPLFLLGHSTVYQAEPQVTAAHGEYGGPQGLDGHQAWRFVADEIAPGMSGGPVLDRRNGAVCGIVKSTRAENSAMGGVVIPVRGLRHLSALVRRSLWREHDRVHARGDWAGLRDRLATAENRVAHAVTAHEEVQLLGLLSELPAPEDLLMLYQRATDRYTPGPVPERLDLRDAANELMDRLTPSSGLHSLLRFTSDLAQSASGQVAQDLAAWTERVALRRGERRAYLNWRGTRNAAPTEQPSLTVQIAPGARDPHRYMITIWVNRGSGRGEKLYCDDEAVHTVAEVRDVLPELLRAPLKQLHGWALVEFVIPPELLNLEFEDLAVRRHTRLGRSNPVVLRDLERLNNEETWHDWRSRWDLLHAGAGVTEWLDCDDSSSPEELDGRLRYKPDIATLALSDRPDGARQDLLGVAIDAGVPALVWRRHACDEHRGHETPERPCSGDHFRDGFVRERGNEPDVPLPELVRKLRSAVVAGPGAAFRGVVLLWDDPYRLPEPKSPLTNP